MTAVWRRELQNYFLTPIGYVFIGMFLALSGALFVTCNINQLSSDLTLMFKNILYLFMLITPVLTMRLLSEEKRTKSDQLLLTSPRSLWDIVLGKFLAAGTVLFIALSMTAVYPIILSRYSTVYPLAVLCDYIGCFLIGLCYAAIGIFMSSLTESQVSAAVLTIGANLMLQLLENYASAFTSAKLPLIGEAVSWLSLYNRFYEFLAGMLSFSNVLFFLSFCWVLLFLTVRVIDARRWSLS